MAQMNVQFCCNCGIEFHITNDLYCRRRDDHQSFYCPAGHGQSFTGQTEAEKLRLERDRLAQRVAQKDDEIKDLGRQLSAGKGQMTKLKKRISHGVCPCCSRTFQNLARHMQTKHPDETKLQCVS